MLWTPLSGCSLASLKEMRYMLSRAWRRENPCSLLAGMPITAPKTLKIERPYDPAISLLGIYRKEMKCAPSPKSQDAETT